MASRSGRCCFLDVHAWIKFHQWHQTLNRCERHYASAIHIRGHYPFNDLTHTQDLTISAISSNGSFWDISLLCICSGIWFLHSLLPETMSREKRDSDSSVVSGSPKAGIANGRAKWWWRGLCILHGIQQFCAFCVFCKRGMCAQRRSNNFLPTGFLFHHNHCSNSLMRVSDLNFLIWSIRPWEELTANSCQCRTIPSLIRSAGEADVEVSPSWWWWERWAVYQVVLP